MAFIPKKVLKKNENQKLEVYNFKNLGQNSFKNFKVVYALMKNVCNKWMNKKIVFDLPSDPNVESERPFTSNICYLFKQINKWNIKIDFKENFWWIIA